jgi:predicted nucleic acid-binding protein
LIVLGKIGHLDLLTQLPQRIVIPTAVVLEIKTGPQGDAARLAVQTKMFTKVNVPNILPELAAWDLGAGETAVLAYALAHPGWIAILDDGAARKCAKTFGIPLKGTLAVIILAKTRFNSFRGQSLTRGSRGGFAVGRWIDSSCFAPNSRGRLVSVFAPNEFIIANVKNMGGG